MKDRETYDYIKHLEQLEIPALKEELTPYLAHKKQGDFTIDDYYEIPDEHRIELIDGVIYDMASPTTIHQIIVNEINITFANYIKSKRGNCISMISPASVQLNCDDKTMIQPDVFIICDKSKIRTKCTYGAPDLVVEVLSPATRKKDINIKTGKYRNAGVREYWMVDSIKKRIYVYEFEKDDLPVLYTFEDKVPVGIWGGECTVDFKTIYKYVRFLEE